MIKINDKKTDSLALSLKAYRRLAKNKQKGLRFPNFGRKMNSKMNNFFKSVASDINSVVHKTEESLSGLTQSVSILKTIFALVSSPITEQEKAP